MSAPTPRIRTFLLVCALVLGTVWVLYAVQSQAWPGQVVTLNTWVYNGLMLSAAALCLLRALWVERERRVWLALGLGLLSSAAGEIYYSIADSSGEVPTPSLADVGYLGQYPACYLAIAWLLRSRIASFPRTLWLDGAIVASAATAVAAALTFDPIVASSVDGDALVVTTNLAYPIADLVLLSLVVTAFALTGWRPGRSWVLLGVGLIALAVTDVVYLFQSANGTYGDSGGLVDAGWPLSGLVLAAAAWTTAPGRQAVRLTGLRMAAMPTVAAVVAVLVLAYDHFVRVSTLAAMLCTLTLIAVVGRMALSFVANQRLLEGALRDALTDALTGLGNRRSLMTDLDSMRYSGPPTMDVGLLVMLDLDGFKAYNDAFGHPAGDSLLARLGHRLDAATRAQGRAYRLGGDEFCVLSRCPSEEVDAVVSAAGAALSEHGEGFAVTASSGTVLLPSEAGSPSEALQLVDRRMYANKDRRRASAGSQSRDVLVSALRERQPALDAHATDVAGLALAVAAELGMAAEQRDEVARAAELHDTGKVAIPDAILNKPGPLDQDEWAFMRRHTIIGERILSAAPALVPVARLVRSSHERWDGRGYPDELAGEEIPLGARVVTVCDAYDAMITDRPYREPMTPDQALAELDRCAGSQFDPAVVTAFLAVMDRQSALH